MDQLCHGIAPWFEIKDVLTGDSFWVLQYYIWLECNSVRISGYGMEAMMYAMDFYDLTAFWVWHQL